MPSSHAEPVTDVEWVLWAGTLGLDSPIAARVEAAQVGGFGRISLSPLDVRRSEAEGTEANALGRLFRDAGLSVVIDPVMSWTEGPLPPSGLASVGVEEILQMAEAIGAESIGAIGPVGGVEVDALIAPFAALCDQASGIGALVHLEFMPMLSVGDLSSAWTVVSGAGRSNGGLLFDTWHFFRGHPDFATLAGCRATGSSGCRWPTHRRSPLAASVRRRSTGCCRARATSTWSGFSRRSTGSVVSV